METAAYHEAGHGVIAVMLGGTVSGLSIATDDGWAVGEATVSWHADGPRAQMLMDDIKTALAGPISEMVFSGDYDYLRIESEHLVDWQIVMKNMDQLCLSTTSRMSLLRELVSDLYHLVRTDHVWSAIGDVAELLLLHEAIDGELVYETTSFWLRR